MVAMSTTGSESPQPEVDNKFRVPRLDLEEMASEDVSAGMASDLSKDQKNRQNEISAPYEAPQFPIEQIEDRLKLQRRFSNRWV